MCVCWGEGVGGGVGRGYLVMFERATLQGQPAMFPRMLLTTLKNSSDHVFVFNY